MHLCDGKHAVLWSGRRVVRGRDGESAAHYADLARAETPARTVTAAVVKGSS
jgi:hypothetical protein